MLMNEDETTACIQLAHARLRAAQRAFAGSRQSTHTDAGRTLANEASTLLAAVTPLHESDSATVRT